MKGIFIALTIIILWLLHLYYLLFYKEVLFYNISTYLHILLQAFLYTGLFITAHDAMHGTVSNNKFINNLIGRVSSFLFAGMSFDKLLKNHHLHHKYPGTELDPDFYVKSQNFFVWWAIFFYRYTTFAQILIMGISYNLLKLLAQVPEINLWFYWIIPAFLGTLQLFYFGTYLPHRLPHTEDMGPHRARTLPKNHLLAFLSCYFFGYHQEHHEGPHIPWWQLWKTK